MSSLLSSEERNNIREFLRCRQQGIRLLTLSANLLLVAGGAAIVMGALFLLRHRTDEAVLHVGLPSFLGGMACFVAYLFLSKRTEVMRRAISMISRFAGMV